MAIALRLYRDDDDGFLRRLAQQPSVRRAHALPDGADAQEWDAFIDVRRRGASRFYMIEDAGRPLGFLTVFQAGHPEIFQVGYCVDEARQNQGVATHALRLMALGMFRSTPCRRLQANVEPDNKASRRVLEKAGFQEEGVLRRSAEIGGELVDVAMYAIVDGDPASGAPPRS